MLTDADLAVVLPTCDDERTLPACLARLQEASAGHSFPVYVVNDGGRDVPPTGPRTSVLVNAGNRGQSYSRNRGATETGSRYVLFVDADVLLPRDCFNLIESFIRERKAEALVGWQGTFALQHPSARWSSLIYNAIQHMVTRRPGNTVKINTSCLLMERKAFLDLGGFDENMRFLEDVEFSRRLSAAGKHVRQGGLVFQHLKEADWPWLLHCPFLGGQMSARLPRPSGAGPGRNRVIENWLTADLVLLAGLLSLPLWPAGLAIAAAASSYLLRDLVVFVRVRRNPLFFLAGLATCLAFPLLAAAGFLNPRAAVERGLARWRSVARS